MPPVAVAMIDFAVPDFTLGWGVWHVTHPLALLNMWLNELLPVYGTRPDTMMLEFYIRDEFYAAQLSAPVSAEDIPATIVSHVTGLNSDLNFLLLNAENNVLELSFDAGRIVQCVCTLREVHLSALIPFFTNFHANSDVRENSGLSLSLFGTSNYIEGGRDFLNPVPVYG